MAFSMEVDNIDKAAWEQLIQRFEDANFYQTWSHGHRKWGENLSHLLLKRDGVVVAAAQATLVELPLVGVGMAHIRFGPMWCLADAPRQPRIYAEMLRALRAEYVGRRGLVLRLKPWESVADALDCNAIREAEGYQRQSHLDTYDTFVLDLSYSLDALAKGLARKWRNDLRKAQRLGMTLETTTDVAAVDTLLELYRGMRSRKRFLDTTDIDLIRDIHVDLPEALKPWVMVCRYEGQPVAAILFSLIGNTALALFGATSQRGRDLGASYFVNWGVVNWLKTDGACRWYDLVGGLATPSIRHFKAGLTKRCGEEVHMPDYDSKRGRLAPFAIALADRLRPGYQQFKARRQRWRRSAL